jgi:glycosyltransferase involved in cell wall biosynthesis
MLPRMLLVLTEFPPSFGGMQTHAVHLCRHLAERGYDFRVATYRLARGESAAPAAGPAAERGLSRIGYWANVAELERMARAHRADVLYSSTVFYGQAAARTGLPMVCRSAGNDVLRPWIVWPYRYATRALSAHWVEAELVERFRRLEWPERWERLLLDRRREAMAESAGCMRRVLANSDYTAELLRGIGLNGARVRVAPGGVDARRFRPAGGSRRKWRRRLGLPESAYVLMTACRLVPKKGLDLLLQAAADLRREMPDLHLLVAGEGRERERAQALAAGLGLNGGVTWAGRVAHDRLREYYWSADQFVLASREALDPRTGLRDVETMGRVLCEANASGTPVVAARSGGIPSVVEHGRNGLLFAEDSLAELKERIRELREDNRRAQALVEEGLRRAEREFDWSRVCGVHEEEFRSSW